MDDLTAGPVRASGRWFLDRHGRRILLRGVNLGGDCKIPTSPDGSTHLPTDFSDHRDVSFIGRPFPLQEAEEHLGRLRHWGFNCLRLLTTWEAVHHAGPDQFDEAYLDYFAAVCRIAGRMGFHVIIDFHQDVFSRMTGGDGAPGWAVEAAGLRIPALHAADAAWVMQHRYDPNDPSAYPQMSWTWNYQMPANGILWSLFFAGHRLVPDYAIDGEPVGLWLQRQFFAAQRAVAERVADQPWVIGFDILNEPSRGWIGARLQQRPDRRHGEQPPRPGPAFSALDGLWLASGRSVTVPWMALKLLRGGVIRTHDFVANPDEIRIWREGIEDPFLRAGAWAAGGDGPQARQEDFFQQVDFEPDALGPFYAAAAQNLRAVNPDWLVFFEKDALDASISPRLALTPPPRAVNATHWYDLLMLLTRRDTWPVAVDPIGQGVGVGHRGIVRLYQRQLRRLIDASKAVGDLPTFVGEFGIPFDMNGANAYRRWADGARGPGVFQRQASTLRRIYDAFDALWLSGAQWNYTASNANASHIGDRWNMEDLSIYSADQRTVGDDPDSGGRGVSGFSRPYARAVQGTPLTMRFDQPRRRFSFSYEADLSIAAPTEIFLPERIYATPKIDVDGGEFEWASERRRLTVRASRSGRVSVVVRGR
ncbi:MAG: cellulase family glycosylhydrolase [Myxococcota bacterium]